MKYLLAFLMMLAIPLYAQTEIIPNDTYSDGVYLSDSLYYVYIDTVGVDDTLDAVTSKQWTTKYQYEWMTYAKIDTGTTYDDTVYIKYQYPYESEWYPVEFCRDSAWTAIIQPLTVDDASQHSFKIYIGDYWRVGFFLTNTAIDTGHVSYFKLNANKKK